MPANVIGAGVRRVFGTLLCPLTYLTKFIAKMLPLFFVYIKIIISPKGAKCKQKPYTSPADATPRVRWLVCGHDTLPKCVKRF